MSRFDEREKEFETRFKHDQELAFRARARRDKLLGLWAAHHLGLAGTAADNYAAEVVATDFGKHGDHALVDKVEKDFAAKGVAIAAAQITDELHRCLDDAKKQIMTE